MDQQSITVQKKETGQKTGLKQRLALAALQKQKQLLDLREWVIIGGFITGGAMLRAAMQWAPSVEPITFFAVLAGWLFGRTQGFITGAGALWVSNFFVYGGQGPWTVPQMVAFGIAGWMGGLLRKKATIFETVALMIIASLIFDIILNASWSVIYGGNILLSFALGIPFLLIHLFSNAFFGLLLPKVKGIIENKGEFDERSLVGRLIRDYRNRSEHSGTDDTS